MKETKFICLIVLLLLLQKRWHITDMYYSEIAIYTGLAVCMMLGIEGAWWAVDKFLDWQFKKFAKELDEEGPHDS